MKVIETKGTVITPGVLTIQIPSDIPAGEHEMVLILETKSMENEKNTPLQKRIPDLHPGVAWISEDFDDPLPEDFLCGSQ